MKNLLLLITLFLTSAGGYLQAQDCFIRSAKISADSNCVFLTWNVGFEKPLSVKINDERYFRFDSTGSTYSKKVNDTLVACDTTGSIGFVGSINFKIFGQNNTCEFKGGESLPACPDDVLVSRSENCLIFQLPEGISEIPPDTVRLNDSIYRIQEYDPLDTILIFLQNDSLPCDTFNMQNMSLNDTLNIDGQVCTYKDGLLPITILAFDYQNEDNSVALSWEVNSEEPTRQLYLQKSYNGVDWMNVYEQSLENYTSGQTMNGQFTDRSIEQPKLYYRLFISGYSGEEKYSNILPVTRKDQVINNLFYQSQSRSIMIKAGQSFAGEMHLINTQGQNVMTKQIRMQKNTYQEIDVKGSLSPGIYFVKFDNGLIAPAKIFID